MGSEFSFIEKKNILAKTRKKIKRTNSKIRVEQNSKNFEKFGRNV